MGRSRRTYTGEELEFVAQAYAKGHRIKELAKLFNGRFSPPVSTEQMRWLFYRRRPKTGCGGKFDTVVHAAHSPGSARASKGFVFTKTKERGWRPKHLVLWEEKYGKVPGGHFVIFADGDRRNVTLGNLLLVTRAEAISLGQYRLLSSDVDFTKAGLALVRLRMAMKKNERR